MRINGWRRLWLLGSVLWAIVILALAGRFQPDGARPFANAEVLFVARLWVVPVAAIYAFGSGLAWVRRGFQAESS